MTEIQNQPTYTIHVDTPCKPITLSQLNTERTMRHIHVMPSGWARLNLSGDSYSVIV